MSGKIQSGTLVQKSVIRKMAGERNMSHSDGVHAMQ